MVQRNTNPCGYINLACCDSCGLAKLPKKRPHFYHCSFCRFDLCPQCTTKTGHLKRKHPDSSADGEEDQDARVTESKKPKTKSDTEEPSLFNCVRRLIWLPIDRNAVSRAPTENIVVSDWCEGVPV